MILKTQKVKISLCGGFSQTALHILLDIKGTIMTKQLPYHDNHALLFIILLLDTHLAQKVPRWFLKPAVCKYPTTVNKSELHILLPKPYSLM